MRRRTVKRVVLFLLALLPLLVLSCSTDKTEQTKTSTDSREQVAKDKKHKQLWTCGMHPEVILDEPGQCPKCGMDLVPLKTNTTDQQEAGKGEGKTPTGERKILYWQAPMDPTEIYDKPGKSKMGMDLVPVYDDQVSSGPDVRIDPATAQNMGVRTELVKRTLFSRTIRTVGTIGYDEENISVVSSKLNGWIEKLYVNYTGQEVQAGQPLLDIYSPELVTTQQEYLLAIENNKLLKDSKFASIRQGAQSLLKASLQRLQYWDIPQSEITRLKSSGKVRKTLRLNSPLSGVIIHKNALQGLHIKEGMSLYQIADLSRVWIEVSIYDTETPWIRVGQKAEMSLSYLPGERYEGKISYIYPYLNEKSRDLKARIVFPNPQLKLKPGMYANIRIMSQPIENALVIPGEAVIRSGNRNIVFVDRGQGRFEPRRVQLGAESDDGRMMVKSGLEENDRIVVSAQFMLDSESRLQEAIQKMLAERSTSN